MATTRSQLQLTINVLDRSRAGFRGFRQRLGSITSSIFSINNALRALAAGGIALGLKGIFDLGSSLQELQNKFDLTFGGAAERMEQFVEDWGEMSGITDRAAKDLLSTTALINQGLGNTQQASADVALSVAEMAADWASFTERPTAEVIHAINAALTGENERLKNLGIVMDEVEKQNKAMELGLAATKGEVSRLDKASASLVLITEKMGVAMGDNERTQDSAARRAKTLAAQFQNVRDKVALAMLPALADMLSVIQEAIGDTDKLAETLSGPLAQAAGVATRAVVLLIENLQLLLTTVKVLAAVVLARLVAGAFAGLATGAIRVASAVETLRIALLLLGDGTKGIEGILGSLGKGLLRSGVIGAGIFAATQLINGMTSAWRSAGEEAEQALDKFFRGGKKAATTAAEAAEQLPGLRAMREEQLRLFKIQADQRQRTSGGLRANAEQRQENQRQILRQLDAEIARLEELEKTGIAALEPLVGTAGGGVGADEGPLADLREQLDELSDAVAAETDEVALERAQLEAEIARLEEVMEGRAERARGIVEGPEVRTSPELPQEVDTTLVEPPDIEPFELLDATLHDILETMSDFGGIAADAFGNAVAGAILFGENFWKALRGGLARAAAAKGAFFAAEALGALAQGILGPDPKGFAAAAKYGAASAAMFALAGVLGGGGSAGSGGGGAFIGAGGGPGGPQQTGRDGFLDRDPTTIVIQGGLLDMSDPRQADALGEAIERLSGRRVFVRTNG